MNKPLQAELYPDLSGSSQLPVKGPLLGLPNGTVIASGCNAALCPAVWSMGLPDGCALISKPPSWEVWGTGNLWLEGLCHAFGELLQSKAGQRIFTHHDSSGGPIPKLPYRSEVDSRHYSLIVNFSSLNFTSPPVATPRRSLFPQGLFNIRECMTTPPIPSSPSCGNDYMDISPLPHKVPFAATQFQLTAPKPEATLNDEVTSSAPKVEQEGLSEASWQPLESVYQRFPSSFLTCSIEEEGQSLNLHYLGQGSIRRPCT